MDRIEDNPQHERRYKAAILAACIVGHLALGVWLAREWPDARDDDVSLEIRFIAPAPRPAQAMAPPPFPVAPQRPAPARSATRPRATLSAPPDRPVEQAESPSSESRQTDLLQMPPSTARLLQAADAIARDGIDTAMPAPRDPTRRRAARLPGRVEPYTPEAIVLREPMSPEDVVKMIGRMFGGNYDPCPDTRSKLRDVAARNERIGEEELRVLLDRERRRCRPG